MIRFNQKPRSDEDPEYEPEPGAYRVVGAEDLFDLTGRGWRLVAVLDRQEVEFHEEPLPFESQDPRALEQRGGYGYRCGNCNNYGDGVRKWKKPHLVATQRFLLHKTESELVADLHRDITTLKGERDDAQAVQQKQAELAAVASDKLGAAQKELAKVQATLSGSERRAEGEANLRRRLEGDISKLRQAIGDLRMKEILGDEE